MDVVCQTANSLAQRKWDLIPLFTNTFVALKHFSFPCSKKEASAKKVLCPNQYIQDITGNSKEIIHMIKRGNVACSNDMWHYWLKPGVHIYCGSCTNENSRERNWSK